MGRVGESRKFLTFVKKSVFFLPPSAPVYNGHKTSIRLFKLWSSVPPVYGKRREMDVCASQFQFWGGEEEKREIDGFVYFLSERDGPLLSCCTTVKKFPPYLPIFPSFLRKTDILKALLFAELISGDSECLSAGHPSCMCAPFFSSVFF